MRGYGHTGLFQGAIKSGTEFIDRQRTIQLFSIDEQSRSGTNADQFTFANRCFNRIVVLRLDARLEFWQIHLMFFSLGHGDPVQCGKLVIAAFFRIYIFLIGMDVVSEIPIGFVVLRSQAVGVHSRSRSPAMDLGQRKILIDEHDPIPILLEQFRKQSLVHPGAERTLEVVEIDYYDLGVLFPPGGPATDIDSLHDFRVWIFAQIELGETNQSFAILGKQEIVILLFVTAIEGDGESVISREFTGLDRPQNYLHMSRNAVEGAHLPFHTLSNVGRGGLSGTAQTNKHEHKDGTSKNRH